MILQFCFYPFSQTSNAFSFHSNRLTSLLTAPHIVAFVAIVAHITECHTPLNPRCLFTQSFKCFKFLHKLCRYLKNPKLVFYFQVGQQPPLNLTLCILLSFLPSQVFQLQYIMYYITNQMEVKVVKLIYSQQVHTRTRQEQISPSREI